MTAASRRWPTPRLGVTYYPESSDPGVLRAEAQAIREAGPTVVRTGEFAWSRLEPSPGRLELDWLEAALEALADAGLSVVLCTPTAQPPAWLYEQAPDLRRTGPDGRPRPPAMEARYCPLAPALLEAADRVVGALADRFARRPEVVGWQVDNELSSPCWCERCRAAFRASLRERYGSLEELNQRLGGSFRGLAYTSWEQPDLPDDRVAYPNPGLVLAARRFLSDTLVRFAARQARILRAAGAVAVTTNLTPPRFPLEIEPEALAAEVDVVSWSNYPSLDPDADWTAPAFEADLVRGLKRAPFWALEQQAGTVGVEAQTTPRPGQTRLWAWQALAHGAELLVFFRWRTSRYGAEQGWEGLLSTSGRRAAGYATVAGLARELDALGARAALEPVVEAAVLYDHASRVTAEAQPVNDALAYVPTLERHYAGLRRLGIGVDVVPADAGLGSYRLVVAAGLAVMDGARAAALTAYVRAGGVLVLAPRSAWKDPDGAVPDTPLPAFLVELAGVESVDYASRPAGERTAFAGDVEGELAGWTEQLELRGAESLARFRDGPFAGSPALTRHAAGAGAVYVVAGAAPDETAAALYARVAADAGLETLTLPAAVEPVRATAGGDQVLVLLNHGDEPQTVLDEGVRLPAYGSALLSRTEGRPGWIPLS